MTTATDHALARLDALQQAGTHERAALLAVAAIVERDLNSPNGYDVVTAEAVAQVIGLAKSTTERTLRSLAVRGELTLVTDYAATRHHHTGEGAARRLGRGERVRGYRIAMVHS